MKKVIVIGAGPAGLTIAYQLLKSKEYEVKIIEKESSVGGLSKSIIFNGNRVDIGGHRYFTKNDRVQKLWNEVLPIEHNMMLVKKRKSHILFDNKAIPYPLKIDKQLISCIGIRSGILVFASYIYSLFHKIKEESLEDFFINRFGKKLYSMFFRDYTKKLWGVPASTLLPDWGSQRIQSLSMKSIIKDLFFQDRESEKSMIRSFNYPTLGSGQVWEILCNLCIKEGGYIEYNADVMEIIYHENAPKKIRFIKDGEMNYEYADLVISTMPLKDLVNVINNSPESIRKIANKLNYRDMVTVSFFMKYEYAGICLNQRIDDCWIYIQEKTVKAGRLQILNNWSECATKREDGLLLQVEYYCNEGENFWNQTDKELIELAITEMKICKIVSSDVIIEDYMINRVSKAYPIYDSGYKDIEKVRSWIDKIDGLYCVGRNGRHIYGNMDQVMESSFYAFDVIKRNGIGKDKIWFVSQDKEYIEK